MIKRLPSKHNNIIRSEFGFLNRDYLWYGYSVQIRVVKIDDFLRESYDIDTGRWHP